MADAGGFEPPTARFVAEYSIQLSYASILRAKNGGEGGIRTLDTLLRYTPLAGVRLQPLGHFSALRCGAYINVSGK